MLLTLLLAVILVGVVVVVAVSQTSSWLKMLRFITRYVLQCY